MLRGGEEAGRSSKELREISRSCPSEGRATGTLTVSDPMCHVHDNNPLGNIGHPESRTTVHVLGPNERN